MNCWTIVSGFDAPRVQAGITVTANAIVLGESGRGRQLTILPLPPRPTLQNDRLIAFGEETGIALVIRDLSGFRGSWELFGNYTAEEWQQLYTRRFAHREHGNGDVRPGHVGYGDCPACAAIPAPPQPHPVPEGFIRAQGFAAQGEAGRMGGGPEYLITTLESITLYIIRRGRTYGTPNRLILTLDPIQNHITLKDAWNHLMTLHDPWEKKENLPR